MENQMTPATSVAAAESNPQIQTAEIPNTSGKVSGYTETASRQLVDGFIKDGHMTRQQGDQALADEGFKAEYSPQIATEGHAAEIDQWFPPAKPMEYKFANYMAGQNMTADDVASELHVREAFSKARFPVAIGEQIFNRLTELGTKSDGDQARAKELGSDASLKNDHAINRQLAEFKFRESWGEKFETNLAKTKQLISEMDEMIPGLKARMDQTGAGNDPKVLTMLFHHAEILHGRKYGRDQSFQKGQKLLP